MKDNITLITLLVLCSTVVFTLVQVFFSLAENIKTKINVILVSQTQFPVQKWQNSDIWNKYRKWFEHGKNWWEEWCWTKLNQLEILKWISLVIYGG